MERQPISGRRMFALLRKLGFERLSTREGEQKAASLLLDEMKNAGAAPTVESFQAPCYTVEKAKLEVTAPFAAEIPCTGYGCAGNAAAEGLEAPLAVIEGVEPMDLADVKGKIVFYAGNLAVASYEKIVKAGAVGIVTTWGRFLDRPEETDREERMLRDRHIAAGQLPAVAIHVNDAMKLLQKRPARVRLTLAQQEGEAPSQNLVAELVGRTHPEEIIVFTAHYDTVMHSKGYFDNATGTAMVLELLRFFVKNPPNRTMRFILCGSEERGLLGSKAYVAAHKEEMEQIRLCVNLDMAGPILGREMASVTGEESLCHALTYFYKTEGFPMQVRQDIYSSDSIPFADAGVPGINFFRAAAPGTSQIHCRHDVARILAPDSLARTTSFVLAFVRRIDSAAFFPIDRAMPKNMVEKLDAYLGK